MMKCYLKIIDNKPLRSVEEDLFLKILSLTATNVDVHLFVKNNVIYYLVLRDYEYSVLGAIANFELTTQDLSFECNQVF